MNKIMIWCTGLALAGVVAGYGQPAAVAGGAAGGPWGRVIEVPGLAALNKGQGAQVNSVWCASAGNCAAGGYYTGRHGDQQGFVVGERNGRWGNATRVPGLAGLNSEGFAGVQAVSCAPGGYCAAGGYYSVIAQDTDGFVAVEKNGVWGKAVAFPSDEDGSVDSIFCASAGNCLAGGSEAEDYFSPFQGFVAQERNGRWGQPAGLPGLAALNKGGGADVGSVWCASAGNCVAGGLYSDKNGGVQGFLATERAGRWGKATGVPGLAALNKGGYAQVNSVACTSAGNCVAGGLYSDKNGGVQGFLATERAGRWAKATGLPGLAALNKDGRPTTVNSVWCTRPGGCVAGGYYSDRSHRRQGFVATEENGRWGTPVPLPGLAAVNKGGFAQILSLSCASPGSCAAAGYYSDRSRHYQAFITQNR
jgi:hypothetical protein